MKLASILKNDSDRFSGPGFGHVHDSQCDHCAHKQSRALKCTAFPEGIPGLIYFNVWDHEHPYDLDGQDDHGITFVHKDEEKNAPPKEEE